MCRFFFFSPRLFFSAFARSIYFCLSSEDILDHNFPATLAMTVTCSLGCLLRSRRKNMMKGLVALGIFPITFKASPLPTAAPEVPTLPGRFVFDALDPSVLRVNNNWKSTSLSYVTQAPIQPNNTFPIKKKIPNRN